MTQQKDQAVLPSRTQPAPIFIGILLCAPFASLIGAIVVHGAER
jgi:hypothetical protein